MRDQLRKNEDDGGGPGQPPAGRANSAHGQSGANDAVDLTRLDTKPTRQFSDLVLVPILPDKVAALEALLQRVNEQTIQYMRGDLTVAPLIPFHEIAGLHFARFVILNQRVGEKPLLAFSTDYDGPEGKPDSRHAAARKALHQQLAKHAGFDEIFAHCKGFARGKLLPFLAAHQRSASTSYVAAPGRSLKQIREEAALRGMVEELLKTHGAGAKSPEQARQAVLDNLGCTIPNFPAQPKFPYVRRLATAGVGAASALIGASSLAFAIPLSVLGPVGWGLALSLGTGSVLGLGSLAFARFLWLEAHDPQFQPELNAETHDHLAIAARDENHFLQNQLTHVVQIKDGPLRWLLIRAVFAVLNELAHHRYNRGKLGDIPSIHFARWVLGPDRSVIFFSNFDSSWQSYLGDFIDKASSGLTAVWSNTNEYPRTRLLLSAGSRDAARFLAWTRANQLPTQVWYSAYPQLSVVNINSNTEIRRGLADPRQVDPVSWLSRLRNVDRLEVDERYSSEQARETPLNLDDIQGLILKGYGHKHEARYLLLQAVDLGQGKDSEARRRARVEWLAGLPVTSTLLGGKARKYRDPLLNVAFTYQGLRALGCEQELCDSFSTAFVQNSTHPDRLRVNHDVDEDDPQNWDWGQGQKSVHVALLIFTENEASMAKHLADFQAQAREHDFVEVADPLQATTLHNRAEHFGFRDGIAQPIVKGAGDPGVAQNTIAAGEILLGHRDGYGNVSPAPISSQGFRFGFNGSYMVLRQLEQDVEGFWRSCEEQGKAVGLRAVNVAAKMVGRWPSGRPLVRHPDVDPDPSSVSNDDGFGYFEGGVDNDRYGGKCPFGAHIRRSNPRDWGLGASTEESVTLSNLHRIMRRGRPYGPPLVRDMNIDAMLDASRAAQPEQPDRPARGLQFMCFNANIERQFEFIQQQWCKNPKFAGQHADADPLLGLRARPLELGLRDNGLTLQSDPHLAATQRLSALVPFVRLRGSAYFFMPSLRALSLLPEITGFGRTDTASKLAENYERAPDDEQLHIDRLIDNIRKLLQKRDAGKQTQRDAHPKMHGLVKVELAIPTDLPAHLQHGLFKPGTVYKGWARFSNQDQTPRSDDAKDTRGLALKLFEVREVLEGAPVEGKKPVPLMLLDGEEDSDEHDFVFLSTPRFVTPDVAGFDELVNAMVERTLGSMARSVVPFARHLRSRAKHGSPLEVTYFSVVPALLGPHAVKYKVEPVFPSNTKATPVPNKDSEGYSPNFLRQHMKKQLAAGAREFVISVQRFENERTTPIEDPTVLWRTRFEPVATLRIVQQADFDTRERDEEGENMPFNPFRCLPEHRPLGGISRARRQVYRAIARFRHDRNGVTNYKPPRW